MPGWLRNWIGQGPTLPKVLVGLVVAALLAGGGYAVWQLVNGDQLPPGFAKANGRIEGCFSSCPAHAYMLATLGFRFAIFGGFDALGDLTLPVPAAFANGDIGSRRAEAFVGGDFARILVEEDVGG